jgi:hypothetical protein
VHSTSKPASFLPARPRQHQRVFRAPPSSALVFFFADTGLLRVSFIRPGVAFVYGFSLFHVPTPSDALSRRSPSVLQSPSAGMADPPANHTHLVSLSHSLHSRHAAYSTALLRITSRPLCGLEDTHYIPTPLRNRLRPGSCPQLHRGVCLGD